MYTVEKLKLTKIREKATSKPVRKIGNKPEISVQNLRNFGLKNRRTAVKKITIEKIRALRQLTLFTV